MTHRQFYRTLFLSDFHIGAKSFNASSLLSFLRAHECKTLYLVGDIIDGWKLQKRWYWHEDITAVFDELVRKAANGTKIIYITGNHDERVRDISMLRRYRFARRIGIAIKNSLIHTTADNRRFFILHGDQFDQQIIAGPLSRFGDGIYDWWQDKISHHQRMTITIDGKEKRFSLAKFLGTHGQRAINALNNFEQSIYQTAREHKADGVICGHTHIAALKSIRGVLYGNCGSWLRGAHNALAEDEAGNISLIDWQAPSAEHQSCFDFYAEDYPGYYAGTNENERRIRAISEKLVDVVRRTFYLPPKEPFSKRTIAELRALVRASYFERIRSA